MVGGVALGVALGGFSVAGCHRPDHDSRYLLRRSGDVESNPGPGGGGCASCGETLGTYRRPMVCAAGCGAVSHRRKACSGLRREDQDRGIWHCVECSTPRGGVVASGGSSAADATLAADAPSGGTVLVASGSGNRLGAQPGVAPGANMSPRLPVPSTIRERTGAATSTERESAVATTSTERERVAGVDTSKDTESVPPPGQSDQSGAAPGAGTGENGSRFSVPSTERERTGAASSTSRDTSKDTESVPSRERAVATPSTIRERVVRVDMSKDTENVSPPRPSISDPGNGGLGRTSQPAPRRNGGGNLSPTLPGRGGSPRVAAGGVGGRGQARLSPAGGAAAPVNSPPPADGGGERAGSPYP